MRPSILHEFFLELLLSVLSLIFLGAMVYNPGNKVIETELSGIVGGLLVTITKRVTSGPSNGSVQINNPDPKEKL